MGDVGSMEVEWVGPDDRALSPLDSGDGPFSVAKRESRVGSVFLLLNNGDGLFTMSD
jgi:hypothetical protein